MLLLNSSFSPQISLVQISISVLVHYSYSALKVLNQFTARQAKVGPTQRSQIRKFNVDPSLTYRVCDLLVDLKLYDLVCMGGMFL